MPRHSILVSVLVVVSAVVGIAQESAPKSRLKQVQDEVEMRRKAREYA